MTANYVMLMLCVCVTLNCSYSQQMEHRADDLARKWHQNTGYSGDRRVPKKLFPYYDAYADNPSYPSSVYQSFEKEKYAPFPSEKRMLRPQNPYYPPSTYAPFGKFPYYDPQADNPYYSPPEKKNKDKPSKGGFSSPLFTN